MQYTIPAYLVTPHTYELYLAYNAAFHREHHVKRRRGMTWTLRMRIIVNLILFLAQSTSRKVRVFVAMFVQR
jgi:hypothetical protein